MKINSRKFISRGIFLAILLAILDAFWFERFEVKFKNHYRSKHKDQNSMIQVLEISDLHLKRAGSGMQAIFNKIDACQTDAICFTDEVVDQLGQLEELEKLIQHLQQRIDKIHVFIDRLKIVGA